MSEKIKSSKKAGVAPANRGSATQTRRQPRVRSVAKAIDILLLVARSEDGLRAMEIGARLGLGRQATYHLLHTLVTLGMLLKGADNQYLLGLRVAALVEAFPRHLAPPERLAPFVREVARATGETAYAVGWVDSEIVTLAVVRGGNAVQAAEVPQGLCADPHSRASGKLLLALVDDVTRERFLKRRKLARRTRNTITDPEKLRLELRKIRRLGYAVDLEEYAEGVSCLAVPMEDGDIPYAICLSAPSSRFSDRRDQYLASIQAITMTDRIRRKAS
jgi:DNA-binding IclR family transcriptional regulator